MYTRLKNTITKKFILGLFVFLFVFLTPVSLGLSTGTATSISHPEVKSNIIVAQSTSGDTAAKTPTKTEVSWFGSGVFSSVGQWLGNTILSIASMFTYLGGTLLDMSLNITVFEMGSKINGTLGNAINKAWTLIRDIANLAFIFGFVYIGIRTIIDPDSASTKRFLSKIIIGALLINFSLFFVKFIVDFSNFTAYQIYTAMVDGGGSLSATVANMLGIVSLFKVPDPEQFAHITSGGMLWFFVFGALLLLIVAFIFFAAAVQLVMRFVALVIIMVGSPILFAATVFPQTEHYASDMWKKLISYAFFAPAFLLLLLISLTLVSGLGTSIAPENSSFVTALKAGGSGTNAALGQMGIILNFVIIIFFFIQSLLIAQKMGVAGGDAAVSIGNKLRGKAQDAITNTSLRYASRQARLFEAGKDGTFAGKIGGTRAAKTLKRLPFAAAALQTAGKKAAGDVAKRTGELKDLRTGQLKNRLNSFIMSSSKLKGLNDLDRIAVYNAIKDKGDLDELDPEQIRDYISLLKKNGLGTLSIDKQRMDTYSYDTSGGMSEIEKNVAKMKNASDIAGLHKITVANTDAGEGGHEDKPGERQKHIDEFVGALIRQSTGSMIEGLARRKDEVTEAFMKQLLKDAGATETKSAEAVAKHFDSLANAEGVDPERKRRNETAAAYFRTSPAARALGLVEGTKNTTKKEKGSSGGAPKKGDGSDGDDDDSDLSIF